MRRAGLATGELCAPGPLELLRGLLEPAQSHLPPIDLVAVTVRSADQAAAYQTSAETLRDRGRLPESTRLAFLPDPSTVPVGSGGAFLLSLEPIEETLARGAKSIRESRVLLIHAGGEGRRIPCTIPTGKLMMSLPLPDDSGRPMTLFECILRSLRPVMAQLPAGLLTVGGDVLAGWEPGCLTSMPRAEVVGFCGQAPFERVCNHALYVLNRATKRVSGVLQKASRAEAEAHGAVEDGQAYHDMGGLVYFRAVAVRRYASLLDASVAGRSLRDRLADGLLLDQWLDLTYPLAERAERAAFLRGAEGHLAAARGVLWDRLSGCSMGYIDVGRHDFAHLGTLAEMMEALDRDTPSRTRHPQLASSRHLMCQVDERTRMAAGSWAADSCLKGSSLGESSAVFGVELPEGAVVPPRTVVFAVPLAEGKEEPHSHAVVVHGIEDDLRRRADDPAAAFCGRPWAAWLEAVGGPPNDLFGPGASEAHTLWTARLFPVVSGRPDPSGYLWFADPSRAPEGAVARWRKGTRCSLAEIIGRVDYERVFPQREDRVASSLVEELGSASLAPPPFHVRAGRVSGAVRRRLVAEHLVRLAQSSEDPRDAARQYAAASEIVRRYEVEGVDAEALLDEALAAVRRACALGTPEDPLPDGCVPGEASLVLAPARIDFAGGWTDTPPQSLDLGGIVVNGAIAVEGRYPIVAYAASHREPGVRLTLRPSGRTTMVHTSQALVTRLGDPFCLLKSVLRHLWPDRAGEDLLERSLRRWGHGFAVETRSWLPEGSGLGTSSIMALAGLRAVSGLFGCLREVEEEFRAVLHVEQLMTAGGGWQDQAGAIVGGLKRVSTEPGVLQVPRVVPASDQEGFAEYLGQHAVLYFVGKRRTAMSILREIVADYLRGTGTARHCLAALAENARELWGALEEGRWESVGPHMTIQREIAGAMCPPSISPAMRDLLQVAAPFCRGSKMVGAGGGGFMLFATRSPEEKERLTDALRPYSWRGRGRPYRFELAAEACHSVPVSEEAVRWHLHGLR